MLFTICGLLIILAHTSVTYCCWSPVYSQICDANGPPYSRPQATLALKIRTKITLVTLVTLEKKPLPQEIAALMLSVAAHTSCRDDDVTEQRHDAWRCVKESQHPNHTGLVLTYVLKM